MREDERGTAKVVQSCVLDGGVVCEKENGEVEDWDEEEGKAEEDCIKNDIKGGRGARDGRSGQEDMEKEYHHRRTDIVGLNPVYLLKHTSTFKMFI